MYIYNLNNVVYGNPKVLSREQYRKFTVFCDTHYKELYENKVGYNVSYNKKDDTFTVELYDNCLFDWTDILC